MSYDILLEKAIKLHNDGALNSAQDIYTKILEAAPYNADVWNLLGLVSQSKGNDEHAVDCFLSAIKYSPKPFAPYFFNLGLSYKALDKKAEAIDALQKVTKIEPLMKEVWNYLGVLYEECGMHEEGIKCFCKALEVDGDYKEARINLCFYSNDKEALIKVLDEDEKDFCANFMLAKLLDNLEEKEKYLRIAVEVCPYRIDALLYLAFVLKDKKELKEALKYYHKALDINENNVEAILGVADVNLELLEYEKAETYYKKSLNIRRDLYGVYLNYGLILYKLKRYSEALSMYREAVKLNSEDPLVSYNLALILKELEDYEEALGLMFNAYLKDKSNETFQIGIMETISLLFEKNAEMALKIAQNWQELDKDNIFSKRLLSALSGMDLGNNDAEYAKKLFDEFAENYDETISRLECNIIDKFKELNPNLEGKVLELGVGTGKASEILKNDKVSFEGVDISYNMIEKALATKGYENLYCEDIESFIKNHDLDVYDKIVSFDVFCYIGNLENIFSKLKGCEVWFSIEKADEERGKDFYLAPSGRYKHSVSYIKDLAKRFNFQEIQIHDLVLRKENGSPIWGCLIKIK